VVVMVVALLNNYSRLSSDGVGLSLWVISRSGLLGIINGLGHRLHSRIDDLNVVMMSMMVVAVVIVVVPVMPVVSVVSVHYYQLRIGCFDRPLS